MKIVIILLIANLPVFWGLFYIFFGSWDKFLDTLESAMGWDYGPAGFDSNRIYFFLILFATLRDFGGFGVHGHLALQAALAVMPAIQSCC